MKKEMILSLLLTCCVMYGGAILLSKSLKPITLGTSDPSTAKPKTRKVYIERDDDPEPINATPRGARRITQAELDAAVNQPSQQNEDLESAGRIKKCTINNKVTYSNKPCPRDALVTHVVINDSAGIISPQQDIATNTTQRTNVEARESNQDIRPQVLSLGAPNTNSRTDCKAYRSSIDQYNAMARQPQSGESQDLIRGEIVKIRRLQSAAHC